MALFDSIGSTFGGAFSGGFTNIKSISAALMVFLIVLFVVCVIGYVLYTNFRNKTAFSTPVSLTVLMENGMEKTRHDLKGGVFWNKGIRDFKVKIPKQWKPHILGYIPDMSKSTTTDGRIHFITYGDRTVWQQVESGWVLKEDRVDEKGDIFQYDLISKPVPREVKQLTVNSIKNWRDTVDKAKLTAFGIAIGAFIIMVIAHLISLFIQTKIKCGT